MSTLDQSQPRDEIDMAAQPVFCSDHGETRWYATYTIARHEKCVAQQMQERRIDCFLPLYRSIHRWKDRRKQVELALFPSYVFVHIALKDRLQVLQLPSVVRIIGFNGTPVPLLDSEIMALRAGLVRNPSLQPHPYLTVGRHARIRSGPMAGLEGVVLREREKFRIVLSIELIKRSVVVEVDLADIEPID
jgi:transcription antitermination factor NusG